METSVNNKCRAFTSMEQSKKLAEILPIESADQTWERIAITGANLDVPEEMEYWHNGNTPCILNSKIGIPCWSLAALLDQMICPKLENYVRNSWDLDAAMDETLQRWLSVQDCPTAVDACYEMILKLNEQKLL